MDCGYIQQKPLVGRPHIAFLLGAGFSIPMGYPSASYINTKLKEFNFSQNDKGFQDYSQEYIDYLGKFIRKYTEENQNQFDYEQFYDFFRTNEPKKNCYESIYKEMVGKSIKYNDFLHKISEIYDKIIESMIHDKYGKNRYNENITEDSRDGYDRFLEYLSKLSENYIVDVHTLNHDLLFESFRNIHRLNGKISDGFDEFGSNYFGELGNEDCSYRCRLERYTGRYRTAIRLYKLHGSLDYRMFFRRDSNGSAIPDKMVKIKDGIRHDYLMKNNSSKFNYLKSDCSSHPDFLSGTNTKIKRYKDPFYKNLLKKFKSNLQKAEKLIIIGYGCKDKEINEYVKKYFDFRINQTFIITPNPNDDVERFRTEVKGKIHAISIEDITSDLFI